MQPPASLKALSDPIYEAFYGLTEQPFAITTDPRFFYLSASHQRAFTELLNGLRRRESLLMLTGDTGTGKTTLCRAVLDALGERTFSAIILNPYMTGAEVLRLVLRDFGLVSHEELRRGGLSTADAAQLIDTVEGFLRGLVPLGSHAVLVLDEAQSLAPAVLDQVRMLTGLEYQGHKLLQVVLCGQPGLQQMIQADGLLALNERITRRVELRALPPEDIPGYIQHRLGVAGGSNSVRFDAAAMQAVADLSRGLPRRINVLCDRALQEGRIEGVNVITAELVKRAARAVAGAHDPLPVVSESLRATPQGRPTASPAAPAAPAPPAPPAPPATPSPVAARSAAPASTPTPPSGPPSPAAGGAPPAPTAPAPDRPSPSKPAAADQASSSLDGDFAREAASVDEFTPPRLPRPGPVQVQPAGATSQASRQMPAVPTPAPAPAATEPASVPATKAAPAPSLPSAPPPPSAAPAVADRGESSAWPLPDETPSASAEAAESIYPREFTYGLEEPRDNRLGRKLTIAAAILLIVGTAGYASWSWDVRDASSLIGSAPAAPERDLGLEPLPEIAVAEMMDQVFTPGFTGLPPAVEPAAGPSQAAPAPSGEPFAPVVE